MTNHPCFNADCRTHYGRLHIPVAPKCNIQCNFCNRIYDCPNESRPGVSSQLLTPSSVTEYLTRRKKYINKSISVIGIAGPGDPMATPATTLETLQKVRKLFPDKLLCLSTNGLNLEPYVDDLVSIKVSHITITINAVDPLIGGKIYRWVNYCGNFLYDGEAAELLLNKQLDSLKRLKEMGVCVKVNTVVIPGINDTHIPDIAKLIAQYKADIHNCIALIPVKGTAFEAIHEPSAELMDHIRHKASLFIKQIDHCKRCRADACGYLL